MKEARLSLPLTEVMKIARLISASRRASSVIAKAKTEAWQTTCSSLSPKSNPKFVYSFLRSIAGSSSSSPNFPKLFSQEIGFGLRRLAEISLFRFSAKKPFVAEPETIIPSFAEPRALRSLTCPSALPSCCCLQPLLVHCH